MKHYIDIFQPIYYEECYGGGEKECQQYILPNTQKIFNSQSISESDPSKYNKKIIIFWYDGYFVVTNAA